MRVDVREIALSADDDPASALAFLRSGEERVESTARDVSDILRAIRERGDEAVLECVRRFDWECPSPADLRVPRDDIWAALDGLTGDTREALGAAAASIRSFHEGQAPATTRERLDAGLRAGIRAWPLASVGLYVPGGRAAYPSTVLMLAIPAQIAGVERIAVATPARNGRPSDVVLAACALLSIEEVYAVGGAAAIGAFAYGTKAVPRVDKVLGPGSAWVAEAKRQVFGVVGIDSIAGPTELVILSDGSISADIVAADLLAQAEHDPDASAILLTSDAAEPARVRAALGEQLAASPRAAIQRESLARRGALVTCASAEAACAAARVFAPEHLEVLARDPEALAARVPTAAAVFLGPYAPEAAGDYGAGPNHSLPTAGTARFSSPVGIWDFVRYQSYLELSAEGLAARAPWMEALASAEGLTSHAASIAARRPT